MNWKWPKTKDHPHRNPWYLIGWRILMTIPAYLCLFIGVFSIWFAVLIFHGWSEARRVGGRVKWEVS